MINRLLLALLFIFLVIFPLGQTLRIEQGSRIVLQPIDLVVALMAPFGFLGWRNQFSLPIFGFLAIATFSLFLQLGSFSAQELFPASLYLARLFAYAGFFFTVSFLVKKGIIAELQILSYLLVAGATIAVLGILQYFIFPDTRSLLEYGWDNHYFRLIGTFLDPAFVGIMLVFFLNIVVSFPWGRSADKKFLAVLLFLLGFFALMLTYSRASYLAFLSASTLLYIVRRNWLVFLLSLILFGATVINLPRPAGEGVKLERTSTVVYRANNYQRTWEIFVKNPLFGIGYNNIRYYLDGGRHAGSGSDSSLLFVLATTGLAGFLVFVFLLGKIAACAWRNRQSPGGLSLLTSAAALLVHSLFNNSIFYPWVITFILILLATQITESKK